MNPANHTSGPDISDGGLGAVLARAGVGKTAVLVQIGLNSLMDRTNVLHVSLKEPIQKVCLWYEEMFANLAENLNIEESPEVWQELLPHRFIMAFAPDAFGMPLLFQRIAELEEQGIFYPRVVLIDGLALDDGALESLEQIKAFAGENRMKVWFSARTHRETTNPKAPMKGPFSKLAPLFEKTLVLDPESSGIHIHMFKGLQAEEDKWLLDPKTMLIKKC